MFHIPGLAALTAASKTVFSFCTPLFSLVVLAASPVTFLYAFFVYLIINNRCILGLHRRHIGLVSEQVSSLFPCLFLSTCAFRTAWAHSHYLILSSLAFPQYLSGVPYMRWLRDLRRSLFFLPWCFSFLRYLPLATTQEG